MLKSVKLHVIIFLHTSFSGKNIERIILMRVVIFGAGILGQNIAKALINTDCKIVAFLDNDLKKVGLYYEGIIIINPEKVKQYRYDYLIIASGSYNKLFNQAMTYNIAKNKIIDGLYFYKLFKSQEIGMSYKDILINSIMENKHEYISELKRLTNPTPLLNDYVEFCEPIVEANRFSSMPLIEDENGNLEVRAWRYSYNARGIIETKNVLNSERTAVIVIHPLSIDEEFGLKTPSPYGAYFYSTPEKNKIYLKHTRVVLNPFLKRMRKMVNLIAYSLPKKKGAIMMEQFYGNTLPEKLKLSKGNNRLYDYFYGFLGLDSSEYFNGSGFDDLFIPLATSIDVEKDDIYFYDEEGYEKVRNYLKNFNIQNVLLCGYSTNVCVKSSTLGYQNLKKDFNTIIVGDATIATFPGMNHPRFSTNAAICELSLDNFVTQISWINEV